MRTRARPVRRLLPLALLVAAMLGGCATPSSPGGSPPPGIAADGEVIGQGTVLQIGDAPPMFCLGGVLQSRPPQCGGPEILG